MGNIIAPYLHSRKGPTDRSSSFKILEYFNEFFYEFVAGLFVGTCFFLMLVIFTGVPADPTLTVQKSNEKWTMILMSFVVSFVAVMGIKASFGFRLSDIQNNPWMNFFTFFVAVMDGRINRFSWWYLIRALLYATSNCAGVIAAAYFIMYSIPGATLPPSFIPILTSTTTGTYQGNYLISWVVYSVLLFVPLFTMNGTLHQYVNVWPFCFSLFGISVFYFYTCKMFPNFAINWALSTFTGNYQILWVDVVGFFTGLLTDLLIYWFFTQSFYEPNQVIRNPCDNLQIPYSSSSEDYNSDCGPQRTGKKYKMSTNVNREQAFSTSQKRNQFEMNNRNNNVFN